MHFSEIDPQAYRDDIMEGRRDLLSGWGVTDKSADPELLSRYIGVLPDAIYIGARAAGSSELAGFTEYYTYASLSQGFESTPYARLFPLATISPPDRMAHIRTIYLKKEYRRRFGLYVRLYATTALHALRRGLDYTTLSTWKEAHELRSIYRRMGARLLCTFDLDGLLPGVEVYLIELSKLVAQPFASRFCRQSCTAPEAR